MSPAPPPPRRPASGSSGPAATPPGSPPPPPTPPVVLPLPEPRPHSRSGMTWFTLALAFLIVAAFAYIARPSRPETQLAQSVKAARQTSPGPAASGQQALSPAPELQSLPRPSRIELIEPATPSREEQFARLINTNLSISSTQSNVGLLVAASGPGSPSSVVDALQGFITDPKIHFIFNLADTDALRSAGFFDDMYSGNGQFLSQAVRLSRLDYILLAKATYSCSRQPDLSPDLLTCELNFTCRLVDRTGSTVQSGSFTAPGPGFSESQALKRAAENVAKQLNEKILRSIR